MAGEVIIAATAAIAIHRIPHFLSGCSQLRMELRIARRGSVLNLEVDLYTARPNS